MSRRRPCGVGDALELDQQHVDQLHADGHTDDLDDHGKLLGVQQILGPSQWAIPRASTSHGAMQTEGSDHMIGGRVPTDKPGSYVLRFTAEGRSPESGRIYTSTRRVSVHIDA